MKTYLPVTQLARILSVCPATVKRRLESLKIEPDAFMEAGSRDAIPLFEKEKMKPIIDKLKCPKKRAS